MTVPPGGDCDAEGQQDGLPAQPSDCGRSARYEPGTIEWSLALKSELVESQWAIRFFDLRHHECFLDGRIETTTVLHIVLLHAVYNLDSIDTMTYMCIYKVVLQTVLTCFIMFCCFAFFVQLNAAFAAKQGKKTKLMPNSAITHLNSFFWGGFPKISVFMCYQCYYHLGLSENANYPVPSGLSIVVSPIFRLIRNPQVFESYNFVNSPNMILIYPTWVHSATSHVSPLPLRSRGPRILDQEEGGWVAGCRGCSLQQSRRQRPARTWRIHGASYGGFHSHFGCPNSWMLFSGLRYTFF